MRLLAFGVLCITALSNSQNSESTDTPSENAESTTIKITGKVARRFRTHHIVPDVIPVPPKGLLQTIYRQTRATLGNPIRPFTARYRPEISYRLADRDSYYTICMVDADCPNRRDPIEKLYQNWLVVNIRGLNMTLGSETLTEYIGAKPLSQTGYHRYVLIAYKQPSKLTFEEPHLSTRSPFAARTRFSIYEFAKKYNFGDPVAGNYFVSQHDQYGRKPNDKNKT